MTGPIDSFDVLGVPVSVTSLEKASREIRAWAGDKVGRYVCVRDVHGIMQAQDSAELQAIHRAAALVTPDGMPLVWLGRRAGHRVERTSGADLMERLMSDTSDGRVSHYFYGGKPGVAATLQARFVASYPGLRVVGTETPPFRTPTVDDIDSAAARIRESQADVVWIGLSTPKQELLMRDLAPRVGATLIGVGAAFDFHSGAVRRARKWMQSSGLEWLHRLASEPRRLWRRYFVMAPQFIWRVALDGLRHR